MPSYPAPGHVGVEPLERRCGSTHDQNARRVTVETVDHAPAPGRPHALQLRVSMKQPRRQSGTLVAGSRVNDETRGLIHDDQVWVFVDHAEFDRLGNQTGCDLRDGGLDDRPGVDTVAGAGGRSVEEHPRFEQGAGLGTAQFEQVGQHLVDPLPFEALGHL